LGRGALAFSGLASYAFAIEPGFILRTVTYSFTPPRWTPGLKLKIVMLADPHVISPYMTPARWGRIIAKANTLEPDVILFMGDLLASHRWGTHHSFEEAAAPLAEAKARLGIFGIIGNHDWWADKDAQSGKSQPIRAKVALEKAGVKMLVNEALRLENNGLPFWLSGTDSIVAIRTKKRGVFEGRDNLPAALTQINDEAPIIHLAHEPDLFVDVPDRVSVTLSGHTHGGQVNLLGYAPVSNSGYGQRFVYGHIVEGDRHLVISGGLGCSVLPVRFGSPPEITVLELG
jgi:uncharacterized protein